MSYAYVYFTEGVLRFKNSWIHHWFYFLSCLIRNLNLKFPKEQTFSLESYRIFYCINYQLFSHQTSQVHRAKSEGRERRGMFLWIVIYRPNGKSAAILFLQGTSKNLLFKMWKCQLHPSPQKMSRALNVIYVPPLHFSLLGADTLLFNFPSS